MKKTIMLACVLATAAPFLRAQELRTGTLSLGVPVTSQTVAGAPYSAEFVTESVQTLADGNRIVHRTSGRLYRDRDGRVRRETDQNGAVVMIAVTDPVAGRSLTLDPVRKTARIDSAVALPSDFNAQTPGRAGGSGARGETGGGGRSGGSGTPAGRGRRLVGEQTEDKLADRTIEGLRATGIRRTTVIAPGSIGNEQPIRIVSEEWTSPDLQVRVLSDVSDPRTGRTKYKLTRINRANPDPALFQLPAGFKVIHASLW
jgi:hypothetical protein